MELTERLSRIAGLRARIAAVVPARPELPGREARNEEGAFLLQEESLPLDHLHGRRRLGAVPGRRAGLLARLLRQEGLREADLGGALFLDTETTSLGGGAGTRVFLVGAGFFSGGTFRVEQYFLRTHVEERALLTALSGRLGAHPLLVTFAGRSFDVPRLRDRYAYHGLPDPACWARHLDLLPAGRALWRLASPDLRLRTLEERLLGLTRPDDIPGEECPAAWFRWLHGDPSQVHRVFRHNLLDVISLAALAAEALDALEAPRDGIEALARARLHGAEGDLAEAARWCDVALALRPPPEGEASALLLGARLRRRRGDRAGAALLWRRAGAFPSLGGLPHVELAKHHEHALGDLAGALREVDEAERKGGPLGGDDLSRRRRRLLARRSREAPSSPRGPA